MAGLSFDSLEPIFHPRSIALAGITVANPEHWTRTFFDSLIAFKFNGPLYLVNRRGGEIGGRKVYQSLEDIPSSVDYVISTVPAKAAAGLVEECAGKGVKAIHFCTAGFGETGEEEGARLEAELVEVSQRKGIRILGPNCMGIYCPESRLSFMDDFPRDSGTVGYISQSGGNATNLVMQTMWRGVRFSKVISYGNACDLNESDFLEYLIADSNTEVIALYIEGVKDGKRFRQVLEKAARDKVVVLLKGGVTTGGARAAAGHTGVLAGSEATWDALCKQLGVIRVGTMEELADTLVTLLFMPIPKGGRVALIGIGGGASVLITDEFERRGLEVPPLPQEMSGRIRQFTSAAGNILRNPIDYSQTMVEVDKLIRTVNIVSRWDGIDAVVGFISPGRASLNLRSKMVEMVEGMAEGSRAGSKPMAIVIEPSIVTEETREILPIIQRSVSSRLPVFHSFAGAANAISLLLNRNKRSRLNQPGR